MSSDEQVKGEVVAEEVAADPITETEVYPTVEGEEPEAPVEEVDELTELKRERDEYLDLAQRSRAEFDNYRRRAARDAEDAERRGRAELARALLPALDNLERALQVAGVEVSELVAPAEPESREVSAAEAFAEGVALVHRELLASLDRAGIEAFDPAGDRFDPSSHEAISTRPADGTESGVVVETLDRGYRIGEALIRPARVVVSS